MLISTAIMITIWVLGFATIPLLIFSIINKSSIRAKALIALAIYIPVIVISEAYLSDALSVDLPFAIVIYYGFAIPFAIIDLASIIVNCVKMKKLKKDGQLSRILVTTIILAIIPVVFLSAVCLRQAVCLKNSYLVIGCVSRGNGGIGNTEDFVYAYDGKTIHLLDMGSAYRLADYLPSDMVKSEDGKTAGGYTVTEGQDSLFISLGHDLLIEKKYEPQYYNVSVKEVYYRYRGG